MEQHIDARVILIAADKIRSKGVQNNGSYSYHQIKLELSYDGYTIMLNDSKVRLTLYFHSKIKTDYKRLQDLEDFYQRLEAIAKLID